MWPRKLWCGQMKFISSYCDCESLQSKQWHSLHFYSDFKRFNNLKFILFYGQMVRSCLHAVNIKSNIKLNLLRFHPLESLSNICVESARREKGTEKEVKGRRDKTNPLTRHGNKYSWRPTRFDYSRTWEWIGENKIEEKQTYSNTKYRITCK